MQNPVTFTPTEGLILAHRLGADDAVIEAILDGTDQWTADKVQARVADLENALGGNRSGTVDLGDALTRAIIEDACDGSTFFCDADDAVASGELAASTLRGWRKAAGTLSAKVGVTVPTD